MTSPFYTSPIVPTFKSEIPTGGTPSEVLRVLIDRGLIRTTGVRDFSFALDRLVNPPTVAGGTGTEAGGTDTSGEIPKQNPNLDAATLEDVISSLDELLAAELADGDVTVEPDPPEDPDVEVEDPTSGMTLAEATDLGLSGEDFDSLFQSTNETTATTASVSNQGDKGKGIPKVPSLSIPNVLGSAGKGASTLTLAAQASLIAAITGYVTNYVASQLAPLQMQVSAVASAVPAGAGKIAQIPGKIMSIKSKISSVKQKVQTIKKKVKSIKDTKTTIQKQVVDKKNEALGKVNEKANQARNRANTAASRAREQADDAASKARKTTSKRLSQAKSGLNPVNKNLTIAGANARKKTNQAVQKSLLSTGAAPTVANMDVQQTTTRTVDPITGQVSFTTVTEAVGPSVETQSTPSSTPEVIGLSAVPSRTPTPEQQSAQRRAVNMYIRNPNSLSTALTLYITNGGTRTAFMEEIGS